MADDVQIDSLSIAIEQSAGDASDGLARLAENLNKLKTVSTGLRLKSTVNGLSGIGTAVSGIDRDKVSALGELSGVIKQLSGTGKISSSFAKQITGIGLAIDNLGDIDAAKLTGLADALSPLASLDRSRLTSYINQLKQLPEVADSLDGMDMDRFAGSIRKAADAMKPLADEMEKVSNGFSTLPTKIQRIIRENDRLTASTKKGAHGWRGLWREIWNGDRRSNSVVRDLLGLTSATAVFYRAKDILVDANVNINDYIENLNLYGVAMGKYAQEQFEYAKTVEAVLGINPSQWTRMQAVIQDMSKSFGVAEGTAKLMSKALTQLTFDYASFYNISNEEAANKVRSAIAGEIEPIRALGKDLSVAKLQLTATELGINGTVDAMTQADKAMLRTITLLQQSESAQGDLARTLEDPANQMRIFAAQTEMLSTALGELFLPILQETMPYAIATVKVLRMVTEEFARLAGFEMPEFKSASTTEEVEALGGALSEAADEAERLQQLSFDQLNILGSQLYSGSGSSSNADKLTAELERLAAIQDAAFMKDVEDTVSGITDEMVDWLTKGQGIEDWTKGVYDNVTGVKDAIENIGKKIGLWDDEGGTKDKLQKVADIIKGIAASVLVIKGIGLVNSIINAVTGDGALATILGKIFGAAENVTEAFDNKNKKLEKQTEDTVKDTAAVTAFAGELAGATKKTDDASDALNIMGGVALWLSGLFTDNPLTPVVDSSNATAAFEELVEQAEVSMDQVVAIVEDRGKTVAEKEVEAAELFVNAGKEGYDELVRLAEEYGVTIVDSTVDTGIDIVEQAKSSGTEYKNSVQSSFVDAEKSVKDSMERTVSGVKGALGDMNQGVADFYSETVKQMDANGTDIYDGLTGPIEEATRQIGNAYKTIADDYAALKKYLSSSEIALEVYESGALGFSVPSWTAPSRTMVQDFYSSIPSGDFQWNKVWSDSIPQDSTEKALNEASDKALADFYKNNKKNALGDTVADAIIYNIEKTLGLLGTVFGSGSLSFGIPAFASGGIVEDGLFMANSSELVGRFSNGRTAVANNEQITSAIEAAVYRATIAANRASGGKSGDIYLDGKRVGRILNGLAAEERRRSGEVSISTGGGY